MQASELLAISLEDLDRLVIEIYQKAIVPNVSPKPIKLDGYVILEFSCSLLQAALICDKIRSDDRAMGDAPTSVFISKKEVWQKLSTNAILTRVVNGRAELNPMYFNHEKADAIPLRPAVLKLGRK